MAHFMLLSQYQENQWLEEPNSFISEDDNDLNVQSIRISAD